MRPDHELAEIARQLLAGMAKDLHMDIPEIGCALLGMVGLFDSFLVSAKERKTLARWRECLSEVAKHTDARFR